MVFNDFKIHSFPTIEATKSCECGGKLHTVSNGWLSEAFFCEKCNNVYILKVVKVQRKNLTKEFIVQAKEEIAQKKK